MLSFFFVDNLMIKYHVDKKNFQYPKEEFLQVIYCCVEHVNPALEIL